MIKFANSLDQIRCFTEIDREVLFSVKYICRNIPPYYRKLKIYRYDAFWPGAMINTH